MSIAEAWVKTAPRHCQDLTGTGNEEKKGNRNNSRSNTGNWSRKKGTNRRKSTFVREDTSTREGSDDVREPGQKTDVTDGPAN